MLSTSLIIIYNQITSTFNVLHFIFQVNKIIRDERRKGVVVKYIECSALLQTNVKNVFDKAVKLAMYGEEKPRKTCTIF